MIFSWKPQFSYSIISFAIHRVKIWCSVIGEFYPFLLPVEFSMYNMSNKNVICYLNNYNENITYWYPHKCIHKIILVADCSDFNPYVYSIFFVRTKFYCVTLPRSHNHIACLSQTGISGAGLFFVLYSINVLSSSNIRMKVITIKSPTRQIRLSWLQTNSQNCMLISEEQGCHYQGISSQ